jgi:hypothetical protein
MRYSPKTFDRVLRSVSESTLYVQVALPRISTITSVILQHGLTTILAAGCGSNFHNLLCSCTHKTGSEGEIFRLPTSTTLSTLGCIWRAEFQDRDEWNEDKPLILCLLRSQERNERKDRTRLQNISNKISTGRDVVLHLRPEESAGRASDPISRFSAASGQSGSVRGASGSRYCTFCDLKHTQS